MLVLNNIYYHPATAEYPILNNVNLTANKGDLTIIRGSSGSGKTTLIDLISGLTNQQKGTIEWNKETLSTKKRKKICGVVFQFPERYFLGLTCEQELKVGHRRLDINFKNDVLKRVGLENLNLNQTPETLSGGQQRRLAMAVQLLRCPEVLLLDEPTAGLDWSLTKEFQELLFSLSRTQLIIVVTHEKEKIINSNVISYQLSDGMLTTI